MARNNLGGTSLGKLNKQAPPYCVHIDVERYNDGHINYGLFGTKSTKAFHRFEFYKKKSNRFTGTNS